jgi:GPH family glycoside/pentoside/hexuronide:cation symporter
LGNFPFLCVIGIYLCSWLGLQVTAAILPYFVINWMRLPDHHFTQAAIAVQGTALTMMFFWSTVATRLGKRAVYWMGIPLTICALVGLCFLQPGQVGLMYVLAVMVGVGLSTAYLVPWSMLPDVLDLDELNTGQRREGIFCGLVVQLQKIAVAIALFLVGKILDWAGFIPTAPGQLPPAQPESAMMAIRLLIGPVPAILIPASNLTKVPAVLEIFLCQLSQLGGSQKGTGKLEKSSCSTQILNIKLFLVDLGQYKKKQSVMSS